jgi:hypothetical protein
MLQLDENVLTAVVSVTLILTATSWLEGFAKPLHGGNIDYQGPGTWLEQSFCGLCLVIGPIRFAACSCHASLDKLLSNNWPPLFTPA